MRKMRQKRYDSSALIVSGGRDTPPKSLGGFSHQEHITGSEQFPCACVTAFSHTSLFLERFLARILNLINSTNQSVKPTDLKITFVAF